ncbi:MAG: hypothetical protein J6B83_07845 [Bacteroidaceae bacterium]|nr:hypothetical protein [Bacteroidaceae bacterium]
MKKTYISPAQSIVNINACAMIATSLPVGNNEQFVDTSVDDGQLGREDNPSRPNIWEQGW